MQSGNLLPNEGVDTLALSLFTAFSMIDHDGHRTGSLGLINMNNCPPDYDAEYFGGLYRLLRDHFG